MAITPPSDLIMDVARAADPQRLKEAAVKLDARAQDANFGALIDAKPVTTFNAIGDKPNRIGSAGRTSALPSANAAHNKPQTLKEASGEAWRSLNALLVQKMIEQATPNNSSSGFGMGKGFAGQAWKSLLAEHVAKTLAPSLFSSPNAPSVTQNDKERDVSSTPASPS